MENKLKVWIARDKDGKLYLYFFHPIQGRNAWWLSDGEAYGAKRIDSNLYPSVKWEDEEPTEAYITLAESQSKQEQPIDWEQRRYEIAKDILSAQHGNYPLTVDEGTDFAVEVADMLIQKTKRAKRMTEYELDKLCERNLDCDCKCIKCPLFAKYVESNNK